ncbi:MAG: YeiH family protein [Gemmataceae bacterium]|nr:YeiH family protein [Gemmataceae bacterium]
MRSVWNSEDGWALAIGTGLFVLSLGIMAGFDTLGWAVATQVWTDPRASLKPVSPAYGFLKGGGALLVTFVATITVLTTAVAVMGESVRRFIGSFTSVFIISFCCWWFGHWAYIAATPDRQAAMGLSWSLGLTGEAGYLVALLAGLLIGNLWPQGSQYIQAAIRPEWYVKIAIVVMGAAVGVKAAEASDLAVTVLFRGFAAIVEAYLLYWAVVYYLARRYFGFSREWAAPLASGISICGVSAAIATGAAIRARPVVPIMVSSLVVIFSVVELLILPWLAVHLLPHEPLVAAAWMGLAVKTDGAAVASGAISEALFQAHAAAAGETLAEGWMRMTTTTVKVFIDVFIGIWAFLLALVWTYAIEPRPGERLPARAIWERFPKFVLGYLLTFLIAMLLTSSLPHRLSELKIATEQAEVFRRLFFVMTFFTIGVSSNFRKLWDEGMAQLAVVYVVCLFGFILWVGLAISWLFFHGVHPPGAAHP